MSEADEAEFLIWLMGQEAKELKPLLYNDDVIDMVDFNKLKGVIADLQGIARRAEAMQRNIGQQVMQ